MAGAAGRETSLVPKLEAVEAENEGLLAKIEELLQAQEEMKTMAATATERVASAQAEARAAQAEARAARAAPPAAAPRAPGPAVGSPPTPPSWLAPTRSSMHMARRDSRLSEGSSMLTTTWNESFAGGNVVGALSRADEAQALRLRSKGVLKVTLRYAKNLMSADSNGLSDPYVIVSSGGAKKTSKTIKKTLNPVWNEEMDLKGVLSNFLTDQLSLKFMDKGTRIAPPPHKLRHRPLPPRTLGGGRGLQEEGAPVVPRCTSALQLLLRHVTRGARACPRPLACCCWQTSAS